MRRRDFIALAGAAGAFPRVALAQQAVKVPRIVVLSNGLADDRRQAIFQGLADYGYVDGKTVVVELLTAPTIAEVPTYAARAVESSPDLILTAQSASPLALKELMTTIPVVFTGLQDPVAIGVVPNYTRPGGNMTGYMFEGPAFVGKRIQIIHDTLPNISRLAVLGLPADPTYQMGLAQAQAAAKALGVETAILETREGDDFEPIFEGVTKSGAQALYIVSANYLVNPPNVGVLAALAIRHRVPTFASVVSARNGILVGYGANTLDVTRRAASYVDAILKGANPGDLPIVQPSSFDLVVNLKTAKALGFTIPQSVLFQATEVIQ